MRYLFAPLAFLCFFTVSPAHAQSSAGPDSIRVCNAIGCSYVARAQAVPQARHFGTYTKKPKSVRKAAAKPRKSRTAKKPAARTIRNYAVHQSSKSGRLSLNGFPAPLVAKVRELESACGARLVSAFRPGAKVRGSGRPSLHASKRAVDMAGNPKCIYSRMKGWPGGYSTDYSRVAHIHISYAPGSGEWGARFAHYRPRKTGVGG